MPTPSWHLAVQHKYKTDAMHSKPIKGKKLMQFWVTQIIARNGSKPTKEGI